MLKQCLALKHWSFPMVIWISGFFWNVRRPDIFGSCSHITLSVYNTLAADHIWKTMNSPLWHRPPQAPNPHFCYLIGPRRHEDRLQGGGQEHKLWSSRGLAWIPYSGILLIPLQFFFYNSDVGIDPHSPFFLLFILFFFLLSSPYSFFSFLLSPVPLRPILAPIETVVLLLQRFDSCLVCTWV